jgi:hypothetical protein
VTGPLTATTKPGSDARLCFFHQEKLTMVLVEITRECAYALLAIGCPDPMFPLPDGYLVAVPEDIFVRLLERQAPGMTLGDVLHTAARIAAAERSRPEKTPIIVVGTEGGEA